MTPIVKYKKLDARAVVPQYATPGAAAADLCAVLDTPLTLAPMQRALVPTGLAIELPGPACVALVYARSGLSIKHGLCMANGVGVIDSDYRGELRVPMVNLSNEPYTIQPGERVAQLCIAPVWQAAFTPADELTDTARGAGGFGSTGKFSPPPPAGGAPSQRGPRAPCLPLRGRWRRSAGGREPSGSALFLKFLLTPCFGKLCTLRLFIIDQKGSTLWL